MLTVSYNNLFSNSDDTLTRKLFIFTLICEGVLAISAILFEPWIVISVFVVCLMAVLCIVNSKLIPILIPGFILTTLYTTYPDIGFYRYQISGRNIYAMEVLIFFTFLGWLIKNMLKVRNSFNPNFSILDYLIILWVLILSFSIFRGLLFVRNSSDILFESRFLLFFLVYILFSVRTDNGRRIRFLMFTLILVSVFLFFVAFANIISANFVVKVGGQTRLIIGEHGFYFGMMAVLFLGLALYDTKRVTLYLLGLVMCLVMVVLSYQRTSYVQLAVSFIVMGLIVESNRRKYFFVSFAVLLLIVFLTYALFETTFSSYVSALSERTSSIRVRTNDPSVIGRYMEYALSYNYIREHPFLGTGMGVVLHYILPSDFGPVPVDRIVPHNELIWMAFKNGIPSVILFCLIIFYATYFGRKAYIKIENSLEKAFVLSAITTLVGIFVRCQFEDSLHKHRIGFMFWVMLGIVGYYIRHHSRNTLIKDSV